MKRRTISVGFAVAVCAACLAPAAGALPDGRAYEQVSPIDKAGWDIGNPTTGNTVVQMTQDGSRVAYSSGGAFAGSPVSRLNNYYVAARGSNGWVTNPLSPGSQAALGNGQIVGPNVIGVSSDFSRSLVVSDLALTPDAVPGNGNIYLRDLPTGAYTLVATTPDYVGLTNPASGTAAATRELGGSPDFSSVFFITDVALTPNAIAGVDNIYQWVAGSLHLASVLPDGTVDPGGADIQTNSGTAPAGDTSVSVNGATDFFSSPSPAISGGLPSKVYMRTGPSTVANISTTQRTPPDVEDLQPALFWAASRDGSKAFFTSSGRLTNDSTAIPGAAPNFGGASADLYEYDATSGRLTDLTVTANPLGADVFTVLGASDDGSYVYFDARSAIAAGGVDGTENVYLWHDGQTTLVESEPIGTPFLRDSFDISPSGRFFEHVTSAQLTSYDNAGFAEVYVYDATGNRWNCASCDPSAAPTGSASRTGTESGNGSTISNAFARTMLDDGTVVFQTPVALVPEDNDNKLDVYEYKNGLLQLISSGTGDSDNNLVGATPDGRNIFFLTGEQLVPQDRDQLADLYDAHVGGGFSAPDPGIAPCTGDACQGTPSVPPILPIAGSITFSGDGNVAEGPAPLPKVKATAKALKGPRFSISVRAPAAGTITASGASTAKVKRAARKAGTYKLTVSLTAKAKKTLSKRKTMNIKVRVGFAPRSGASSSAVLTLHVKAARTSHAPKTKAHQ